MMYNIDTVAPFELADNQRDGNPMPCSLSVESVTINNHAAKMENIYQSMLIKPTPVLRSHMGKGRNITTCDLLKIHL